MKNTMKKYEAMKRKAIEDIIETLKDGYNDYYCDLHNEVFNTDYYIVGRSKAIEALEEYGVFEAIEKIMEYENFNFGEVYTNIADPEKVVNMLYYIIGEEVIAGLETISEYWDDEATEENNSAIIEELEIEKVLANR